MGPRLPLTSQHEQMNVPVDLPITYLHFNPDRKDKPLLVLLHGYSDTAAGFVRRALTHPDSEFEILAPNGLFPIPVRLENGWKRTFAWYFADSSRQEVLIPPTVSATALGRWMDQMGLSDRPKILIGFSQGGFLLPFLLPHLGNVKRLISIGAAYRKSDYGGPLPVPLDAIHGRQDKVVSLERAENSFFEMKNENPEGEFKVFDDLGHTLNDQARIYLKSRIREVSQ